MRKMYRTSLLVLSTLVFLAACSNGNDGKGSSPSASEPAGSAAQTATGGSESPAELPEVELTWYYGISQVPPDQQTIENEVNKIVKDKINATVKLKPIDFGSYTTKLNTASAAGEKFDLVWTANWAFNYDENVKKGAFIPLDELLEQYAPETKQAIPGFTWDATKYKGEVYAVPNYQTVTARYGINLLQKYVDKYNFDVSAVKELKDVEPLFEQIKKNEPGITPLVLTGTGTKFEPFLHGYDDNGVKIGDTTFQSGILEKSEEYKSFVELLHGWFEKGYINDDASTLKQIDSVFNGKYAATLESVMKPGYEAELKLKNGGFDVIGIPLTEPMTRRTSNITTMTAVSRTSAHPERAVMLLELVNTNPELYNLLSFGLEGKHYEKLDDKTVKVNPQGGYTAQNWVFGNVFNGYLVEGQAPDTWEKTKQLNESAFVQPTFSFKFDDSQVKAEFANVNAVKAEYEPLLLTGTVDPDKYLPEYLEKLDKAGAEKVQAELQKQLDAWAVENGKK